MDPSGEPSTNEGHSDNMFTVSRVNPRETSTGPELRKESAGLRDQSKAILLQR